MPSDALWGFPDPLIPALAFLRQAATENAPLDGMTFGTTEPEPTVNGGPMRPHGVLSVDFSYGQYPVLQTANLRLVVWAATAADAMRFAQRSLAVALSYPGGSQIRSTGELNGPLPANDPGSDTPICTVTFAARLRPITIEE